MTAAYAPESWDGFALAVVTAAATLTGLLFVAVSINLQRILSFPNLPPRAGQTLILFSTPLFSGLLRIDARTPPSANTNRLTWLVSGFFPAVVSCGCLVVAAATLLAQAGGGLYWFVPSALGGVAFGLINAWVLLVEILR